MKIRVYYEDTDAGGVVYHSNYLKFCERARSELFFVKNVDFNAHSGHFLLTKAHCEFLKPARLADIVEVKTKMIAIKNASLLLKQEIFKKDEKIFEADFTLAFVKDNKAAKIPQSLKNLLEELFV